MWIRKGVYKEIFSCSSIIMILNGKMYGDLVTISSCSSVIIILNGEIYVELVTMSIEERSLID